MRRSNIKNLTQVLLFFLQYCKFILWVIFSLLPKAHIPPWHLTYSWCLYTILLSVIWTILISSTRKFDADIISDLYYLQAKNWSRLRYGLYLVPSEAFKVLAENTSRYAIDRFHSEVQLFPCRSSRWTIPRNLRVRRRTTFLSPARLGSGIPRCDFRTPWSGN